MAEKERTHILLMMEHDKGHLTWEDFRALRECIEKAVIGTLYTFRRHCRLIDDGESESGVRYMNLVDTETLARDLAKDLSTYMESESVPVDVLADMLSEYTILSE